MLSSFLLSRNVHDTSDTKFTVESSDNSWSVFFTTKGFPSQDGDPPMISPTRETTAAPVLRKEDVGRFENVNPSHVTGEELFESDILLSPEQRRQLLEWKATSSTSARWPNGPNGTPVVPYKFGDTAVSTTAVEEGLAHWEEHTCINFQLISGTTPSNYLNFLGTVFHEVGHAMGFFHEQSRSDRDGYVSIIFENIQASREGNFQKNVDNKYSVKYDFISDLHYGSDFIGNNASYSKLS
ncbi:blastula protease 10-like [Macrobrachium rosenbergii]|uniref:blastula protease 10-like n=1 Tax=Macrobrachium rosenbergii TaxID=79674 RepID=UPI0034D758C9